MYIGALASEGLPIGLRWFDASVVDGGVLLTWRTLSETECFGFHLLRSRRADEDGAMLQGSFFAGARTSTVPRDYRFFDWCVQAGTWFYRLVQTDLDGSQRTHGPVRVAYTPGTSSWGRIKGAFGP